MDAFYKAAKSQAEFDVQVCSAIQALANTLEKLNPNFKEEFEKELKKQAKIGAEVIEKHSKRLEELKD